MGPSKEEFLDDLSGAGRAMCQRLLGMAERDERLRVRPTGKGFEVCARTAAAEVPLVQMWAGRLQRLETRRQWMLVHVEMSEEDERGIDLLLRQASFVPTSGSFLNAKLEFSRFSQASEEHLDKLEAAVAGMAEAVLRSPPRMLDTER